MRILLTGGTGFIGSAVLRELRDAGHTVTAVVRSESSAGKVKRDGVTPVIGDVTDSLWLAAQLRDADGAIHAAVPDDGSAAEFDDAVIAAVLEGFAGTDKPFVYTTGVWIYGAGTVDETSAIDAPTITEWREERQARLLAGGINAKIVAPGIVYGYGKGIPNVITGAPTTESGALTLVGSGDQHWTTIHVDDLAALYVLVLENAPAGEIYLGVSGVNPTVRELGEAASLRGAAADTVEATRERLGAGFAEALLIDQQATGAKARALGWEPTRPTLVEELSA